jgi:hypothetical protein
LHGKKNISGDRDQKSDVSFVLAKASITAIP